MELWWTAYAILGWVFLSAGLAKLVKLGDFARDIHERVPRFPSRPTALAVALSEVACGGYMLVGSDVRGAAIVILGLLAIFSVVALTRVDVACGCGGLAEFKPGKPHALANLALAVLSASIVIAGPSSAEWPATRILSPYVALALLLALHVVGALHGFRGQRILIDQQRFGG